MRHVLAMTGFVLLLSLGAARAQDVMKYGEKHLTVVAEDDKVRVLRYAPPAASDKGPMHSHPPSVVYVVKGGKVRYSFPDGSVKEVELKAGDVKLRSSVTHSEQALTELEVILVEMKK